MGDRTNIADAQPQTPEVVIKGALNAARIDLSAELSPEWGELAVEALDAAGYDVVLRADPDTSDDTVKLLREQADIVEDAFFPATAAVMRSAADKLAALLERAVTAEAAASLTSNGPATVHTFDLSVVAERDAERAARVQAEAEARQLREQLDAAQLRSIEARNPGIDMAEDRCPDIEFLDLHAAIDALDGYGVVLDGDDGTFGLSGIFQRVTERGEEGDVGPGWSKPDIYMIEMVEVLTGHLVLRTDFRNLRRVKVL